MPVPSQQCLEPANFTAEHIACSPCARPGRQRSGASWAIGARKRSRVDVPEWKQQLVTIFPEQEALSRQGGRSSTSGDRPEEVVEDLFTIDGGWSVEALEDEDDGAGEALLLDEGDEGSGAAEEGELGMAARSILASIPKHRLRALEALQADATEANAATKANARRRAGAEHKTHSRLRIVGGAMAGRRLLSGRGETTRPMMEKVRKAVFDMLTAWAGGSPGFLAGTRWLDLFAGTGSVGLEALSRGAGHCHFIELDAWVVGAVLGPNIEACGAGGRAAVHTGRAEAFLQRARERPQAARQPFDYNSVCPPYLAVSYDELFGLLGDSPLVHANSVIFVEYPQSVKRSIPERLGPLTLIRDRSYGRTQLALYGPE